MENYFLLNLANTILFAVISFYNLRASNKRQRAYFKERKRNEKECDENYKANLICLAVVAAICFLFWWGVNYLANPVMTFDRPGLYLELVFTSAIACCLFHYFTHETFFPFCVLIPISGLIILLFVGIYGWDCFHAAEMHKLLVVEERADSALNQTISPIPLEKMVRINDEVAYALVKQKMGDLENRCDIGRFTKQNLTAKFTITEFNGKTTTVDFKNQIVYVAPLEHKGFWKWNRYGVTNGYALVNACDPSEYYLVNKVNGVELELKYLESSYWNDNISRRIQRQFPDKILRDFGIELDENGRPYNTITVVDNQIGFGTLMAVGTIVADVQTGEAKFYSVEETPDFVNMIQPHYVVENLIYCWGEYNKGWFNPSQEGRRAACDGMDVVYSDKGCSYYVGIKAKNADVATIGYMLVDTRSGKAIFCSREGINENRAKEAMEANPEISVELKQNTIKLDDAVFYNVDGMPTYFATFISPTDNMPKYYSFCCADNKEVVGIGTDLAKAKADYLKSYYEYQQRKGLQSSNGEEVVTALLTMKEKVQENNSYYFLFEETGDIVFYAYSDLMPEIRWKASKVKITYKPSKDGQIPLMSFERVD